MSNPHTVFQAIVRSRIQLIRRAEYFHTERMPVGVGQRGRVLGQVTPALVLKEKGLGLL